MPSMWKVALAGYMAHVAADTPGQALDRAIEVIAEKMGREWFGAYMERKLGYYEPAFIRKMRSDAQERVYRIP